MKPVAAVLLLLITTSLSAATEVAPRAELAAFEQFIGARLAEDRVPGMTVGLLNDGATWVRGFGEADLENHLPMKADSSFRIASLTKTMTAVAVLQLAESGKLDLDAEVQTYVSWFPRKAWPVTIRQLLLHQGGISHYRNRATEQHIKEHRTTREAVAIFENFDLIAEPGTKYSYSSYGYVLLGAVIEAVSGQSYGEYMRMHIFEPLGMSATRLDDPVALIPNRVRGYQLVDGHVANSEFIDVSSRFAAGGLRSTVPDLLRFADGLMRGRLLSSAGTKLMLTPATTRDGVRTGTGIGCFVLPLIPGVDTNGRFGVMNDGGQQETRTFLMMFPARRMAFATAMNLELNTDDAMVQRIAQIFFHEPLDFAPVSADGTNDIALRAMQLAFTLGLAERERDPAALPVTPEAQAKALAYFNDAVTTKSTHLETAPLTILGRAMADQLHAGAEYSSRGAIAFFNDFVKLRPGHFPSSLEEQLPQWSADWAAATPAEVRSLVITADADFDRMRRTLEHYAAGKSVRPNFAPRLSAVAEKLLVTGNTKKRAQAAAIASALYPAEASSQFALGLVRLFDDPAEARRLLSRAEELDGDARSYAGRINRLAYSFANNNELEAGIRLLIIGTGLHPDVANLFDSLGELYLRAGNREKAIAAYRKALEVDPKSKNAEVMLEKLR
jgi:CubicO group peptidase (beta-lactamase class C family)/tetratricopeptide (TPR) repeat protein